LSAEDVACQVKVLVEPAEGFEEWKGRAEATFGPIPLEPSNL